MFGRNRICTEATEAEVARAKNVFKTNLFMQLDGTVSFLPIPNFIVNLQDLHQCVKILEGNCAPFLVFVMHELVFTFREMLTYGRRIPLLELDYRIEVITCASIV